MEGNAKIVFGIGAVALVVVSLMMLGGGAQSVARRKDASKAKDKTTRGKVTENPDAGKPVMIEGIRAAAKDTDFKNFGTITDANYKKLTAAELSDIHKALVASQKYRSAGQFMKSEPGGYMTLMVLLKKMG